MSRTPEPELPAKVPESGNALTPDLPPRGVAAPELWAAEDEAEKPRRAGEGPRERADGSAEPRNPEPKDPKPQEPTD